MDKKLIYAVDDEASILDLYRAALTSGGYDVETFEDASGLYAALEKKKPDLILLDIMLEKESGFDVMKKLSENPSFSSIPVIMVSAKGDELSKVKGLDLGASDYIPKPFGVLELLARVKANLRKSGRSGITSYKDIEINDQIHEISVAGEPLKLTLKEYEILSCLLSKAGSLVTRDELFESVWGTSADGLETRTIDVHVSSIRKKIAKSEADITTVRGVGYILK
jgi:two-component system alkaline phosphatase synthesis response regulator PhoP